MFGKSFHTRKEANAEVRKQAILGNVVQVRKLSKKLFPRRKKLFHVGTEMEWLNFA